MKLKRNVILAVEMGTFFRHYIIYLPLVHIMENLRPVISAHQIAQMKTNFNVSRNMIGV